MNDDTDRIFKFRADGPAVIYRDVLDFYESRKRMCDYLRGEIPKWVARMSEKGSFRYLTSGMDWKEDCLFGKTYTQHLGEIMEKALLEKLLPQSVAQANGNGSSVEDAVMTGCAIVEETAPASKRRNNQHHSPRQQDSSPRNQQDHSADKRSSAPRHQLPGC